MKLSQSLPLLVAASSVCALKWPGQKNIVANKPVYETASSPPDNTKFDTDALLAPPAQNPELFTKVTTQLMRLKHEPLCHRIAAQVHMNSCKGFDSIEEKTYNYNHDLLQKERIDTFGLTLAMCDLERAKLRHPDACFPFTSGVLYNAYHTRMPIHISSEEATDCIQALSSHERSDIVWTTWTSYRESSVLFCRAAGLDLSKDQAIDTHRMLVEILESFAGDLATELKVLKQDLASRSAEVEYAFQQVLKDTDSFKTRLQDAVETVSADIEGAGSKMKSILDLGTRAHDILGGLTETIRRGQEDVAAEHRNGMQLARKSYQAGLDSVHEKLVDSDALAEAIGQFMASIHDSMSAIAERQERIEKQSETIFMRLENATEALHGHTQELQKASDTATYIHERLQKVAVASQSLLGSFGAGGWLLDGSIIMITSVFTLLIGSWGLEPTVQRNLALSTSGLVLGLLLVKFGLHWEESSLCEIMHRDPSIMSNLQQKLPALWFGTSTSFNHSSSPDSTVSALATQLEVPDIFRSRVAGSRGYEIREQDVNFDS